MMPRPPKPTRPSTLFPYPTSYRSEADRGARYHRDDGVDRTEKRPLEPSNRRHEHARARRVGELLRMRRSRMEEAGDSPRRPHTFAFRPAPFHAPPMPPAANVDPPVTHPARRRPGEIGEIATPSSRWRALGTAGRRVGKEWGVTGNIAWSP